MSQTRWAKGIDWPLIILGLAILIFGVMNVYSVDPDKGFKQMIFAFMGIGMIFGLIIINSFDKSFFETFSPIFYFIALLLLVGVLFFGKVINGAKAWYSFGSFSYQPAEFAKYSTALILANLVSQSSSDLKTPKTILQAFGLILVPIFLILLQPDLGSVIVFSAFFIALYREGLSPWFLIVPIIALVLFLISIVVVPFYSMMVFAYFILILCLIFLSTTYNQDTLKVINGVLISIIIFFGLMLFMVLFIPTLSEETLASFVHLYPNLSFSFVDPIRVLTMIFGIFGIFIASIPLMINWISSEQQAMGSPFKYQTGIKSNLVLTSALFSTVVFIFTLGISFVSPVVFEHLPKHQKERIMVLYEGEKKYRDTSGYNLLYSKTAIGSGDLLGKGYNQGTVKKGKFVPEQWTDYIFCTVGEEWGFVGSAALVIVYGIFIARIFYLAESQRNPFSRYFGYSAGAILLLHYFINIAMVIGLFPTVGIPLPFFSYGGSSLWGFCMLIGTFLILNYKDKITLI